jgi:hypothetical protein
MIKIDGTYFSIFVLFPMTECLRSATLKISGLIAALSERKWLLKKNSADWLVKYMIWISTMEEIPKSWKLNKREKYTKCENKDLNAKDVTVYCGMYPISMIQGCTCSQTFQKKDF